MTSPLEIEKAISEHLQKTIVFSIESKVLKKGRLILFCIKDFFCVFTLISEEKKNKKIVYEIPYPFDLNLVNKNKLIFDYSLDTFCKINSKLYDCVNKLQLKKTSKLFNKKISITAV